MVWLLGLKLWLERYSMLKNSELKINQPNYTVLRLGTIGPVTSYGKASATGHSSASRQIKGLLLTT